LFVAAVEQTPDIDGAVGGAPGLVGWQLLADDPGPAGIEVPDARVIGDIGILRAEGLEDAGVARDR
jgi:hypothetical protein